MGDICNVNTDFPAAIVQGFNGKGIVKILGIRWVNGEGCNLSHVPSKQDLSFIEFHGNGLGFLVDI